MEERKRKIIEEIEELNQKRASIKHDLKSFEEKKSDYSKEKYEKVISKYNHRLEKVREKIHKCEDKLKDFC